MRRPKAGTYCSPRSEASASRRLASVVLADSAADSAAVAPFPRGFGAISRSCTMGAVISAATGCCSVTGLPRLWASRCCRRCMAMAIRSTSSTCERSSSGAEAIRCAAVGGGGTDSATDSGGAGGCSASGLARGADSAKISAVCCGAGAGGTKAGARCAEGGERRHRSRRKRGKRHGNGRCNRVRPTFRRRPGFMRRRGCGLKERGEGWRNRLGNGRDMILRLGWRIGGHGGGQRRAKTFLAQFRMRRYRSTGRGIGMRIAPARANFVVVGIGCVVIRGRLLCFSTCQQFDQQLANPYTDTAKHNRHQQSGGGPKRRGGHGQDQIEMARQHHFLKQRSANRQSRQAEQCANPQRHHYRKQRVAGKRWPRCLWCVIQQIQNACPVQSPVTGPVAPSGGSGQLITPAIA